MACNRQANGKWEVRFYVKNLNGLNIQKHKSGFNTKREALDYENSFKSQHNGKVDMLFSDFVDLYFKDMESRLRRSTLHTKKNIVAKHILPYFGNKKLDNISVPEIRKWQNELLNKGFKATFLRSIHNQLSALFNYGVRYYDLKKNPCRIAGSMGRKDAEEQLYWTLDEFKTFIKVVPKDSMFYVAFMTLYWTGMREGELLALSPGQIDFEKREIFINRSYQRLKGEDIITEPKTERGKRTITIPDFLSELLKNYIATIYGISDDDRIFPIYKTALHKKMVKYSKESGVKQIRIHDLRGSHASLLGQLRFTPKEVADRLGHEKIETTLNIYSHVFPDTKEEIARRLEELGGDNL